MKFGFRTPSFKRSLSAATKGAAKRALMREIVPYYGKRGMGWSNPKKAVYNHLYNMTTANPIDIVLDKPKSSRISSPQKEITRVDYENKANALAIYKRGLKQCEIPLALMDYIKDNISNTNPIHKAICRLHTYVSGYMNKPMSCGFDYCDMCNERLLKLQRISPEVKEICLNIVECIKRDMSANDIFMALSSNKSFVSLTSEHQIVEDDAVEYNENVSDRSPVTSYTDSNRQQQQKGDLKTWQIVLRCIGAILVFIILIWIIAEFVFPAILIGLIFLSILFAKK